MKISSFNQNSNYKFAFLLMCPLKKLLRSEDKHLTQIITLQRLKNYRNIPEATRKRVKTEEGTVVLADKKRKKVCEG